MRSIIFLLVIAPLSMWAQNCPTSVQEALTIEESTVVIDNAVCVINDAEMMDAPCPQIAVLFPNPCLDNFGIKGLAKESIEGFIYSIDGRLVSFVRIDKEVDVGYLAQGVYILRVKDSSLVFKFIKQ